MSRWCLGGAMLGSERAATHAVGGSRNVRRHRNDGGGIAPTESAYSMIWMTRRVLGSTKTARSLTTV